MEHDSRPRVESKLLDDGEMVGLMEPMKISEANPAFKELTALASTLSAKASALVGRLTPGIVQSIGELMRSVNCYYSNLIEGHDTHPIDIEKALEKDYSADPKKRDLQREAVAHIRVQEWLDKEADIKAFGIVDLTRRIHHDFYAALPEDLRIVTSPDGTLKEEVGPGEYRQSFIQVGRHVAVSPGAIPRFMRRWEEAYPRRPVELLLSQGAMHHRLAWIHPFADGNGRAARLVAHGLLRETGVGNPLWALSRGLARDVDTYKKLMEAADERRRGDMDGRGTLSEKALVDFSFFFLERCLDQVTFMERLIEPKHLQARIMLHLKELVEVGELDPRAEILMPVALQSGNLERGDIPGILGVEPRTANRVAKTLTDNGMLAAKSHRAPLHLNFKAVHADRWLPGLFPARAG